MNHSEISAFIWSVADLLRGDYKQHEYGDIILPFTILRRLDCVLAPTKEAVLEANAKFSETSMATQFLMKASGQNFYNTSQYDMKKLTSDPNNIVANTADYICKFSSDAEEIFEKFDLISVLNALDDKNLLFQVIEKFCEVDLSIEQVDNAAMGDIYEELIRKFSEMSNETAGEHFSPRDGLKLAVDLVTAEAVDDLVIPGRIITCYDPCCGTGGALTCFEDRVRAYNESADVLVYGQELNPQTYAMAKADIMLKGGKADAIMPGNTLSDDKFPGKTFAYQVSNPPYGVKWEKVKKEVLEEAKDPNGRFVAGTPRVSDGQLLFVQHMISKMRARKEGGGRVAVFLNGSPLFTGAAGSGESDIRKWILENDLLEGIVAMPTDFFFNTGIATYIWVLNNKKPAHRKNKVQLVNATDMGKKMRKSLGSKRKELDDAAIEEIVRIWSDFKETEICKIFDTEDFGYTTVTVERPLRDEEGNVVTDKKGRPKPDSALRDTENIPLKQDIDEYFEREVLPYAEDAWMDRKK
ncbi:MAG: N-6 DNA methylase, partial [Anaerotardibacter sp.]